MRNISKENDGIEYHFVIVDTLSRKLEFNHKKKYASTVKDDFAKCFISIIH